MAAEVARTVEPGKLGAARSSGDEPVSGKLMQALFGEMPGVLGDS